MKLLYRRESCDKAKKTNARKAFTMIEIVFVIVITGLVSVAGSKAIIQILQNYTLQKEYGKIELDSAAAIRQISNYLQNSVWDSIAFGGTIPISQVSTANDGKLNSNTNKQKLYFIEKDLVSQNGASDGAGYMQPYFAGFIDLEKSGLGNVKDKDGNIVSQGAGIIVSQTNSDDFKKAVENRASGLALYFPFINVGTSTSGKDKYHRGDGGGDITKNMALFAINQAWNGGTGQGAHYSGKETFSLKNEPQQIGDIAMLVNAYPSYLQLVDKNDTKINNVSFEKGDLVFSRREPGKPAYESTKIARKVSNLHLWTESSSSLIRVRICFEAGVTKSIMEEFCKEGIIMQ